MTETTVASGHPLDTPGPAKFAARLPGRIPSLDGLRAISILLVVVGHAISPKAFPTLFTMFGHLGNYGVRIFFLISGFLITTLLLKEHDRTGHISLKNFYIRRSLRIFPAFYLYVATIVVLSSLGMVVLYQGDLLHTLTYTMNYHMKRSWYLNHIWSLSVEEQFYLLWPAVVLLAKPRGGLRIAMWVVLLAPIMRVIMAFGFDANPTSLTRHFQAVSDALATGCLLAGFYNWLGTQGWYMSFSGKVLGPVGVGFHSCPLRSRVLVQPPAVLYPRPEHRQPGRHPAYRSFHPAPRGLVWPADELEAPGLHRNVELLDLPLAGTLS